MSLNLDDLLLKAVFETISNEVQVLEAVRDTNHVITDFKYLMGSKAVHGGNEDLSGHFILSVYPWKKETGLFDQFVKVVESGEPIDVIFNLVENDLNKWYHIKAKKFNNGLVVYKEDVTMAKQAEEKIMQLNRALFTKNRELEALGSELKTFNTIAANDYNETLKNLYNSMEFIVNNDARNLSDAGRANIRRAQAAIQKMKLLTDDIIAFSKIHSEEQMTHVDLNECLAIVLNGLDEKIKIEKAVVLTDQLPVIIGYPPLISLLFYHLISNAIKFRKEELSPIIEIRHSVENGANIEHSAAIKDVTYNMISVIDNGIGFDPQEGEKIFTMFYRLHEKGKQKGSGIGLAICKKIMDLHSGFIASECTPECTTFKCYFPAQKTS
ncbi:MAG TPA: ATP-binding protein [Chitinophagaceae bacterium]|jgi:light-regulated signal transduction histidine kinase (bacteriophytochrome)|nr:ATP-binding protein [Chitinophagaceae bacterium]